jgi:hypothetical protein
MSRVIAILATALLCACAAPAKKFAVQEGWPEYKVDGKIGLVVTSWAAPVKVVAPPDEAAAASLDAAAEKKRKEQSLGVAATALSILMAPLALLTPVAPMMAQAAVLPFAAADATSKAGQDADRLRREAAKTRLDAACSAQLTATREDLSEKLQRAVEGDSLVQAIQAEVRESLEARARVAVVPLDAQRNENEAWARDPVLKDASDHGLSTVFAIEIQSLDFRVEAVDEKSSECRYTITTDSAITWWNVKEGLKAYQSETLARNARLPFDTASLSALLDQPDAFRLQLARTYRDAVLGTFNVPTLKFTNALP